MVTTPRYLTEADCWCIHRLRDAETFFRAISQLLPDVTHLYLEGSPSPTNVAVIQPYAEKREYLAPIGTIWSWPRNQRFSLTASPPLFARLAAAAAWHAEPESCDH